MNIYKESLGEILERGNKRREELKFKVNLNTDLQLENQYKEEPQFQLGSGKPTKTFIEYLMKKQNEEIELEKQANMFRHKKVQQQILLLIGTKV